MVERSPSTAGRYGKMRYSNARAEQELLDITK
ncbi:hypothetical protein T11_8650 [Trichinella zimbabwensis]|uniref:Uncharacterized protein n=1 Tax=Trichinella zimbabwensis TaxID=268475 RepID=A0A0V1GGC3_9BILA|nr:hypothetical protein T11_8650 [Trichinella zimbabwensis]